MNWFLKIHLFIYKNLLTFCSVCLMISIFFVTLTKYTKIIQELKVTIFFFFISKQPITTIFSRQFNITRETVCNMEDLFLNHINNKKFIACNSKRCEHEIKKLNYKIYVQVDVNAIKKNHRVQINILNTQVSIFFCS